MPPVVRRLSAADAPAFRELRLDGLARHPEAFAASWVEEATRPLTWFEERLEGSTVLGGWVTGGSGLPDGLVGLTNHGTAKLRHKAFLWGMYVRAPSRGAGLATALVAAILEQARSLPSVEQVHLSVVATNEAAVRLYRAAGFVAYGLERRALKVGDACHDELLMALPLVKSA